MSIGNFSNIVAQVIDNDLYTYLLDNRFKTLIKKEYTGELVKSVRLGNMLSGYNETGLHLTPNNELIVFDNFDQKILTINPSNLSIMSEEMIPVSFSGPSNLMLDLYGNMVFGIWKSSEVDDSNYIFTLETSNYNGLTTNVLYRYDLSSVNEYIGMLNINSYDKEVVSVFNSYYETIEDSLLYENSNPFNSKQILINYDNFLFILNDRSEVLKFQIHKKGIVRYVSKSNITANPENVIQTISVELNREYNESNKQYEDYFWCIHNEKRSMYKLDKNFSLVKCFSLDSSIDTLSYSGESFENYTFTAKPSTLYNWSRKYIYLKNNRINTFSANVYTEKDGVISKSSLFSNLSSLYDKNWYHLSLTYDKPNGKLNFYVDNKLQESKEIEEGSNFYNFYKTGISIGRPILRTNTVGEEFNCNSYSFDGSVYDVRLYDYQLSQGKLASVLLGSLYIDDIKWNIPVNARQYIEQIEKFFMYRSGGNASSFYKIKLVGLNIYDQNTRNKIENIIKETVKKVSPIHTTLYKIEWE